MKYYGERAVYVQIYRWMFIDRLFRSGESYSPKMVMDKINKQLNKHGYKPVSLRTVQSDLLGMEIVFGDYIRLEEPKRGIYRYENKNDSILLSYLINNTDKEVKGIVKKVKPILNEEQFECLISKIIYNK